MLECLLMYVCVCEQPKCTGSTGGGGGLGSVGGSGESHKSSKLESRKRGVVCVYVCVCRRLEGCSQEF